MAITDIKVRTVKPLDKPFKLTDGEGMHLLLNPNRSKYWRIQYRFGGKQRMALGFKCLSELLDRIDCFNGRNLTKLAARLTLLVFIRSSKLLFARWEEIDFKNALWTIPAEREPLKGVKHSHRGSKMCTPHLAPLSRQASRVLEEIKHISGDYELVFIGDHHQDRPMSENTVNEALRSMGHDTKTKVCGHGFWAMVCSALIESGLWSRDVVERQMSHQERNNVRAVYILIVEHFDERRLMIHRLADYFQQCESCYKQPFSFNKM